MAGENLLETYLLRDAMDLVTVVGRCGPDTKLNREGKPVVLFVKNDGVSRWIELDKEPVDEAIDTE